MKRIVAYALCVAFVFMVAGGGAFAHGRGDFSRQKAKPNPALLGVWSDDNSAVTMEIFTTADGGLGVVGEDVYGEVAGDVVKGSIERDFLTVNGEQSVRCYGHFALTLSPDGKTLQGWYEKPELINPPFHPGGCGKGQRSSLRVSRWD